MTQKTQGFKENYQSLCCRLEAFPKPGNKMCYRSGWVHRKHADFAPARQSLLGFRLRSPLLRRGTVPTPPSNGFLSTQPDLS